jgi:hypothetical protein
MVRGVSAEERAERGRDKDNDGGREDDGAWRRAEVEAEADVRVEWRRTIIAVR